MTTAYSHHNLCPTVENRARYETQPCTVAHMKVTALYHRLADEDGDATHIWETCHKWSDHAGGLKGGTCHKCGKTLKEVRVRVNPKTGEPVRRSSLAREIARTAADVPPVRFVGLPQGSA